MRIEAWINMENIDLHVHTIYSDGNATIREAIQTAKEKRLDYLAISDHFTTSWKGSIMNTINFTNFKKYRNEIKKERECARFNCLIGIEIDMESSLDNIRKIPFDIFEILLFEYVDSIIMLKNIGMLIQELEIKAIVTLAHNSYFKIANLNSFSKLLVENDIYFELNSRYLNRVDQATIQKIIFLKNSGVKFRIGSDAHILSRIGDTSLSIAILEKIDGFDNLIDLRNYY